jgi:hypothetical protein
VKNVKLTDWPRLEENVDEKIEEIENFCAWWKGNVTLNKRTRTDLNADQRFSLPEAEVQTGISQQTVSAGTRHFKPPAGPTARLKIYTCLSRLGPILCPVSLRCVNAALPTCTFLDQLREVD